MVVMVAVVVMMMMMMMVTLMMMVVALTVCQALCLALYMDYFIYARELYATEIITGRRW